MEECQYEKRLVQKLKSLVCESRIDLEEIKKAVSWAKKHHDKQYRKTGEPFYTHPLEVAYRIAGYLPHTECIVGSILHDIIEDTSVDKLMIQDEFGTRIAEIVDRLTRDREDGTRLNVGEIFFNALQNKDYEVMLIKSFDGQHNLDTASAKGRLQQINLVQRTIQYFIIALEYIGRGDIAEDMYNKCIRLKRDLGYTNPLDELDTRLLKSDSMDYFSTQASQNN